MKTSRRVALAIVTITLATTFAASACQPHEIAAWNAVLAHRQSVKDNPFLVCVRAHESDTAGSYLAQNPRSTASGAYQFLDTTWRVVSARAGHGGFAKAKYAPSWVQDAVAYDTAIIRREKYHWRGTGCPGS